MFVRRVYLIGAGRIPTYKETLEFLDSKDPNKREKLIEKLLHSQDYVNNMHNFWSDIFTRYESEKKEWYWASYF